MWLTWLSLAPIASIVKLPYLSESQLFGWIWLWKHQRLILTPRSLVSGSESQLCGWAFCSATILAPKILILAHIWIPGIPIFCSPGCNIGTSCAILQCINFDTDNFLCNISFENFCCLYSNQHLLYWLLDLLQWPTQYYSYWLLNAPW